MDDAKSHIQLNKNTSMPSVGFGTYLIENKDAANTVLDAIKVGYRHVDTAAGYQNEDGVGEGVNAAISGAGILREDIFVTTKLWPGNAAWGQTVKSEKETLRSFEDSLIKLNLDYLDLYLIHAPFAQEHRLEQWQTLINLKAQGKVRSIGVSNYNQLHLQEIVDAGLALPEVNQIELHPWFQRPDLVSFMDELKIKATAYSSLAPLSTWRIDPGQNSAKTDAMKHEDTPFPEMAARYGVTEAQLLLRWGVQNGFAVLPKSGNRDRMKQNLDLFSFSISEKDMQEIKGFDRGAGIAWADGDPSFIS